MTLSIHPPARLTVLVNGRAVCVAAAHLLLLGLCLYPILGVAMPPLIDYPNHLARLHILTAIDSDPVLQSIYRVEWGMVSNLAMDTLVPLLAPAIGLEAAAKGFIAAGLALIVLGTVLIRRALFGSAGFASLAVYIFLLNHTVAYGFANYLLGIGVALVGIALWMFSDSWPARWRLLALSAMATLLFAIHLTAFLAYGLAVAAMAGWRFVRSGRAAADRHRVALDMGQFAIPVLLFAAFASTAPGDGALGYVFVQKLLLLIEFFQFSFALEEKIIFILVFCGAAVLVFSGILGVDRRLWPGVLVLLFLAFAMPTYVFVSWGHDIRLLLPVFCLLSAGITIARPHPATAIVLILAVCVIAGFRGSLASVHAEDLSAKAVELREAFRIVPPGSAVLAGYGDPGPSARPDRLPPPERRRAYVNFLCLALLERPVFVPTLFTTPHVQPVAVRPAYERLDTPFGDPPTTEALRIGLERPDGNGPHPYEGNGVVDWRHMIDWPANFDFLVLYDAGLDRNPFPDLLQPARHGSFFTIYRIVGAERDGAAD